MHHETAVAVAIARGVKILNLQFFIRLSFGITGNLTYESKD